MLGNLFFIQQYDKKHYIFGECVIARSTGRFRIKDFL